jgi:L-lactate dehydrogenase
MIPELVKYSPNAIFLIVTNPVDILTYVTYKISGLPANRIIGSGTVLDTSRFRYLLREHTKIDTRNIHTYIIGEHGDSEVPTWSLTNIAGVNVDSYCDLSCKSCDGMSKYAVYENVKNAAYEIIKKKGATYYAVALAVKRIVECILRDENSILTVSSLLTGQYGLKDMALSLPTVVCEKGIDRIIEIPLSNDEQQKLIESGKLMSKLISSLEIG